ncbi:MAG: OmpA family protein [Bacteroidota bacterium]
MTDIKIKILALFILFSFTGFCQTGDDVIRMSPWKVKKFADNAIRVGDIYSAIDYYEVYTQAKPENQQAAYDLADLYRLSRDYKKAADLYKKVYQANEKKFPKALYYYAIMLKMDGNYTESLENLEKFRKKLKSLPESKIFSKQYKIDVEGCKISPMLMDSSLKILITHLDTSVNKAHIDFSPISIDKETMIYASLKADDIEYFDPNDTINKMPVRKFYKAKRVGSNWKTTGEFDKNINNPEYNSGNGAFSPDECTFYFTRSEKNWQNKVISQIYVSRYSNGKWQEPEKLPAPVNDPKYTSTQPTVGLESTKNQEVLYYVSDKPNGKGGLDIWFTLWDKKNNQYKTPKNAGSKINTIGDEMSPYYDLETRRMYYSSNGFPGLGGFDILKSTGELSQWSEAINIGYPLNSSTDDIYFTVSKDRERGFFVSNREGGVALRNPTCCDDIYEFRWTEFIHIGIEGFAYEKIDINKLDTLRQFVENLSNNDSLQNPNNNIYLLLKDDTLKLNEAVISLFLVEFNDGKEETFLIKRKKVENNADFFFDIEQGNDYKIVAECDGYFNNQVNLTTKNITNSDTLYRILELKRIPFEAIVLENIYYEYDKSNLTTEARATIDTTLLKILLENPKLIVELSSHTDSKGEEKYNLNLSQKRAESVVNYLIGHGIETNRLIAKGYGEVLPVASNINEDGSDNPEGRQKNRRTEFKIIGSSDQFSKLNKSGIIIKRGDEEIILNNE